MTRVAIRCDGGRVNGAGHVARCLPIAAALSARSISVEFVGDYDGFPEWLLDQRGLRHSAPTSAPCGLDPAAWDAAIVDLYLPGDADVCSLASQLPVATIGEATRCPGAGTWIEYHPAASPPRNDEHLSGAAYIPVDPRFSAGARLREDVHEILVTVGGSERFDAVGSALARMAVDSFPAATVWTTEAIAQAAPGTRPLPSPVDLVQLAPSIDLAVSAAGLTPYEMAAAGIPCLALGVAENQRVVLESCRATGIALAVDGIQTDPAAAAAVGIHQLMSPALRRQLSKRGPQVVDGRGAERIAAALTQRWGLR